MSEGEMRWGRERGIERWEWAEWRIGEGKKKIEFGAWGDERSSSAKAKAGRRGAARRGEVERGKRSSR